MVCWVYIGFRRDGAFDFDTARLDTTRHLSMFLRHQSIFIRHLSMFIRPSIAVPRHGTARHGICRCSYDISRFSYGICQSSYGICQCTYGPPSMFIRPSVDLHTAIRRSSHHYSLLHQSNLNDQKTEKCPVYKGKPVFVCTLTTQPLAQCTLVGDQYPPPMSQD